MAVRARIIVHMDMDAFFAAIEQRDHPELRGKPVIVGARPEERGVVATASYEARRFGIRSAMPSRTAAQRCPEAIFVAPRHDHYEAVSRQVMALLQRYTPEVEPVSIDEAFLDVTGAAANPEAAESLARQIKTDLRQDLQLTGSIGIAPNKFLAKLASDLHKPDGLTVVPTDPEAIREFLADLPASRIWGVGPATAAVLERRGMRTIGDLQRRPLPELIRTLGASLGPHVHRLAFGLDDRPVEPGPRPEKSISRETTFAHDVADRQVLRRVLLRLTEQVGRRLRHAECLAATAQVKLRFADFHTITRQQSLPAPGCADRDLLRAAGEILDRIELAQPVRLIGFGVTGLCHRDGASGGHQLLLFESPADAVARRNAALDRAVDHLRDRFGDGILKRGRWDDGPT